MDAALGKEQGLRNRTTRRTPMAARMLSPWGRSGKKSKTVETERDEQFQGLEVWGEADHRMTCGNLGGGSGADRGGDYVTPRVCQKQNGAAPHKEWIDLESACSRAS